jgi:hypothetical protein
MFSKDERQYWSQGRLYNMELTRLFTNVLFNDTARLSDCVGLMPKVRMTNKLKCGSGRDLI